MSDETRTDPVQAEAPSSESTTSARSIGPGRWRIAGALAILVIGFVAYLPAISGDFIWDDDAYVEKNEALRTAEGLGRIWFEVGATPQYYPLVFTTFWVEHHLWGLTPAGYHVVNILLHLASALLVWSLLNRLGVPGAWFAGALFAVHPVHVESVAWITERKNVLSGLFYLAAMLAYARFCGLEKPLPPSRRRWGSYGLALVLFVCALLSKSVTCSLPAVLLLLLWWKRQRLSLGEVAASAPMFVIGLAMGLHTAILEREHVGAEGVEWALSFVDRCLIAGRALWFYAAKLVYPKQLTFIYPRWDIDPGAWWQYLPPIGVIAVVVALWLLRRRLGKGPIVAVLIFAGTLFPALGFFNVYPMRYSFVADHFQYLASIALIALLMPVLKGIARRLEPAAALEARPTPFQISYVVIILLVLAGMTWKQCRVYRNLETLWVDTARKNPTGWMPLVSLGVVLADQGRGQDALALYHKALEYYPDAPEAHTKIGYALASQGNYRDAITHYEKALAVKPRDYGTLVELAIAHVRREEYDQAIKIYERAIGLKPRAAHAYFNLGMMYARQEKLDDAVRWFRKGLEQDPDNALLHCKLGLALLVQGDRGGATEHLQRAVELAPDLEEARVNLSRALAGPLESH